MHRNWVNTSIVQRLNVNTCVTSQKMAKYQDTLWCMNTITVPVIFTFTDCLMWQFLGECMYFFEAVGIECLCLEEWNIVQAHCVISFIGVEGHPWELCRILASTHWWPWCKRALPNYHSVFPTQHWFLFSLYTQSLSPIVLYTMSSWCLEECRKRYCFHP